jgi:hypothetical protein
MSAGTLERTVDRPDAAVRPGPEAHSALDTGGRALTGIVVYVLELLLPGERLTYDLVGFVPRTRAAVAAYGEGYAAGVAGVVRRLLFESFWMHGIDIGDPNTLRTLMVDELRGGSSPSEPVRQWGIPADVTGGPISTAGWRLVQRWESDWQGIGDHVVPVVQVEGQPAVIGVDAVKWLGHEITDRGLEPELPPAEPEGPLSRRELPPAGWVAAHGGRWVRSYQQLAGPRRTR